MRQDSQTVTFHVHCQAPRTWVVATRDNVEAHVVEMRQGCPGSWSASMELMSGDHLCRYYSGDNLNVNYYRPASVEGSLDYGLDALITIHATETPTACVTLEGIPFL